MSSIRPKHRNSRQYKGFSLVEAAIVLGVIGLVVGGIWIAAAAVRENLKINDMVKGIGQVITNSQTLFAGVSDADIDSLGSALPDDFMINSGLVPRDWAQNGRVVTPLSDSFSWGRDSGEWQLHLMFNGNSACRRLVINISSMYAKVLTRIHIANTDANTDFTTFPVDPAASIPACETDGIMGSDWHGITFSFRSLQ